MASNKSIVNDKEAFQCLLEISNLLNTGLDEETLSCCVRLCEEGNYISQYKLFLTTVYMAHSICVYTLYHIFF
ncbi:hypothetical protein WDU94_006850 [Cyamophila willieti]